MGNRPAFLKILSLSIICANIAESQSVFTKKPSSPFLVLEGNDLFLQWNYTFGGSLRDSEIILVTNGPIMVAARDALDIAANKPAFIRPAFVGRVEANITDVQTNLTFLSVNRTDSGEYRLKLENSDRKEFESDVTVTVLYPPEFTSISDGVVLVEGEGNPSVTLACTADGEPTPNITWTIVYANGSDSGVLVTENQLVLENNRTDSGTYRCTAYNGIGNVPNRTVKVEVNFKPEIIKPLVNDSTVCGDVINITCSAVSRPAVYTYQLFENGILVVDGNSSAGVDILKRDLKEGNLSYRCVANNIIGTTEETVNITVKVPSKVYPLENITVIEGDNVTLTCNASGSMPTVTWTEVSTGSQSNGIMRYLINISRNDAGEYKCEAVNDCGNSSASSFLTVHLPSSIIQITQHQDVTEGDNVTLMCNVSGVPPPTVSWTKPNGEGVGRYELKIENVSRSEAGEYKCEASNECGNATNLTSIDVQYKPENLQFTSSALGNKACVDDMISFNCLADANPNVTSYQLFENDTTILNTSTVGMWKRNVSVGGVSKFRCVANNSIGSGVSSYVMVTVNVPSTIVTVQDRNVTEGENVTLTCTAFGMPQPNVSWIKPNGESVAGNDLKLVNTSRNEVGEYECVASNECGNATKRANIDVHCGSDCFAKICSSNPSNQIRGIDRWSSGAYGAGRSGGRTHRGVDIVCAVSSHVYAPFPATVVRKLIVYSSPKHIGKPYNTGLVLRGTGAWQGYEVKMFYVEKTVGDGRSVNPGASIGTMTDRASADPGMTNHVHVELYKDRRLMDPTSFVTC